MLIHPTADPSYCHPVPETFSFIIPLEFVLAKIAERPFCPTRHPQDQQTILWDVILGNTSLVLIVVRAAVLLVPANIILIA